MYNSSTWNLVEHIYHHPTRNAAKYATYRQKICIAYVCAKFHYVCVFDFYLNAHARSLVV